MPLLDNVERLLYEEQQANLDVPGIRVDWRRFERGNSQIWQKVCIHKLVQMCEFFELFTNQFTLFSMQNCKLEKNGQTATYDVTKQLLSTA